jgi:aspartate racemase
MLDRSEPSLGILGGMGPEATHHFFGRVIEQQDASKDQDHIRVVIESNPSIPDRTRFLYGNGSSPLPKLRDSVEVLESADVDIIVIPCNTAHYFIDKLDESTSKKIINMVEETTKHVSHTNSKECGLLATDGTIQTELYEHSKNFDIVTPTPSNQEIVMEAIYGEHGIKAGEQDYAIELLNQVLADMPVETVILGCTEISIIGSDLCGQQTLIDPLEILAQCATSEVLRARD